MYFNESRQKFREKVKQGLLNYTKQNHVELLNKKNITFTKDRESFMKLNMCRILQQYQIAWEMRYDYFKLVEAYYQNKITILDFKNKFLERDASAEKCFELLESEQIFFTPYENSIDFGMLVSDTHSCCQEHASYLDEFNSDHKIGNTQFRSLLEEIYQEMKKY